ncbi:MAG: hypothetical protein JSR98_20730 [Proteobacteria bacterium]|nr:hypothetical protein [Pseudomonadota bacterium]
MPSTKQSLSAGVVRSPAFRAVARRYAPQRPPLIIGLGLAASISVILWIAAAAGAHLIIVEGLRLAAA